MKDWIGAAESKSFATDPGFDPKYGEGAFQPPRPTYTEVPFGD
jgi:hypothetical protein